MLNIFLYLLNYQISTGKWKENTGKAREICQSENVGTMGLYKLHLCGRFVSTGHVQGTLIALTLHSVLDALVVAMDHCMKSIQ